jgi:protein-disulfide isomerase
MQRIENRWTNATRALAIGIALACAPLAFAQNASTAPLKATAEAAASPEAAAIRKALEQKFPGAQITHVAKSGYLGLYEVMLDDNLIYTDANAAQKSRQIWCSADKAKAWDVFFASGKLPDNKGDCGDPVAKTQALGNSLHINATPTLIFADGTMIPGALPLAQLEKEMSTAEIEAKKLASQK